MIIERTFRFRGSRDYLHSTSLFDDILQLRGDAATCIDMTFHRRTAQQVSYTDVRPANPEAVVAEWHDAAGALYVVERDAPITEREPYDEARLAGMCAIAGRVITIPADIQPFTRVESIIASFKRLLHSCRELPPGTQYAFVRLRLQHCPQGTLQITYARSVGSFMQGDISEQGAGIGQVFFGVWQ